MDKEEIKFYVKKSCENILKQLAENPKEMLDLLELQDKYNNLLKEKIELKRQIKKQKEVINDYKEDISNLLNIIHKNCNELKCTSDEWLVIQKYQDKEVSE